MTDKRDIVYFARYKPREGEVILKTGPFATREAVERHLKTVPNRGYMICTRRLIRDESRPAQPRILQ